MKAGRIESIEEGGWQEEKRGERQRHKNEQSMNQRKKIHQFPSFFPQVLYHTVGLHIYWLVLLHVDSSFVWFDSATVNYILINNKKYVWRSNILQLYV